MIKKIIAALLISIQFFGICSFAEDESKVGEYLYDVEDASLLKKIDVMNGFGLIDVYMDGSFRGFMEVSRGEFAHLICDYLGIKASKGENKGMTFSDVKYDNENYEYINAAYELGLLRGKSADIFAPDESITNIQATKILLNAMDYGKIAENYGGYPTGYTKLGISLGILNNAVEAQLTKKDVVEMLYDAYEIRIPKIKYVNGLAEYEDSADGETILSKYHKIYKKKGIVEGNQFTLLATSTENDKNTLLINDTWYTTELEDANSYLGYEVEYYAKIDDNKSIYQVMAIAKTDKNNVIEIDSKDLISADTKTRLNYYENDKEKTLKISSICDMIYNGASYPYFTEDDYFPKEGTVTFLDNTGDKVYDVCFVRDVKTVVCESVSKIGKTLKGVYTSGNDVIKTIDFEEIEDKNLTITKNGSEITFDKISQYDVLSIESSKDKSINTIYVTSGKKSGTVKKIDDDENKIVIDETEYDLSYAYLTAVEAKDVRVAKPKLGTTISIYLNNRGEVAYIGAIGTESYGYVRFISSETSENGNKCVKMFTEDETTEMFDFADKVSVNGVAVRGDSVSFSTCQLVRYALNEHGQIKKIVTATTVGDNELAEAVVNDTFRVKEFSSITYRKQNLSLNSQMYLDDTTKIFVVPNDDDEKVNDDTCYYLTYAGGLSADQGYHTYVYDYDNDNYIKRIVIKRNCSNEDARIKNNGLFIVESVRQMYDDKNDEVSQISGLYNGNKVDITGADSDTFDGITKGDVLQLLINDDGRAYYVKQFFDISQPWETTSVKVSSFHSWPDIGTLRAVVTSSNTRILRLTSTGGDYALRPTGSVAIYDVSDEEAFNGSFSDLLEGDYVIVRYKESTLQSIIAIRQ